MKILVNQNYCCMCTPISVHDPEPEIDDELASEITPLFRKCKSAL